ISSKESTLQLVYDVLRLTPFFKVFLVTADVPEIYMQEFRALYKVQDGQQETNCQSGVLQGNVAYLSKTPCQTFDEPPFKEEILAFLRFDSHNNLKARSQEKDTIIMKLKERIKSLSGNLKKEKIKKELEEIETINLELDHRVTKLVTVNEHLKQTYKQLYDSIKSSPVRSKDQCDDLIKQVNIKSAEN
nr:hypothetical protein [Tanacetum cinerariifolium]